MAAWRNFLRGERRHSTSDERWHETGERRVVVRLPGEPDPETRAALERARAEDRSIDVLEIRRWT